MTENSNPNNLENDELNPNNDESDYKDLINRLKELNSTITLLNKTLFK